MNIPMKTRLLSVDTETTGLRKTDRVISIAIIDVTDPENFVTVFYTLLNPARPISKRITKLTGITDADVAEAPIFDDVAGDIEAIMATGKMVAHNASFDERMIRQEFERIGWDFTPSTICTLSMSRQFLSLENNKLSTVCDHLDIDLNHHEAISDAQAAGHIYHLLKGDIPTPKRRPTPRKTAPTVDMVAPPSSMHADLILHLPTRPDPKPKAATPTSGIKLFLWVLVAAGVVIAAAYYV